MSDPIAQVLVATLEQLLPPVPGSAAAMQRRLQSRGLEINVDAETVDDIASAVRAVIAGDDLDAAALVDAVGGVAELFEDPGVLPDDVDIGLFVGSLLAAGWRRAAPASYALARSLGVVEVTEVEWQDGSTVEVRSVDPAALAAIVADPGDALVHTIGWGGAEVATRLLRQLVARAVSARGGLAQPYAVPAASLDLPHEGAVDGLLVPLAGGSTDGTYHELALHLISLPGSDDELPGLLLRLEASGGVDALRAGGWQLGVEPSQLAATLDLAVRPGGLAVSVAEGDEALDEALTDTTFRVSGSRDDSDSRVLLGDPRGSRLEVRDGTLELALSPDGNGGWDAGATAAFASAALILDPGGQDGFVAGLLGDGTEIELPTGVRWSMGEGLSLVGGTGLEVVLCPHLDVGPLTVDTVQLGVAPPDGGDGEDVRLRVAADLTVQLGPVTLVVERLGVQLALGVAEDGSRPFALDVGVLPPSGVGISVEAPAVTGGGFLSFDPGRGRYAGAISLSIGEIGVGAIGLLTTGDDGWSLITVISTSFPPIPLGFGFSLTGMGGLLGVHRTADIDELRDGIRQGTLGDLLFPDDPVEQATELLAGLERSFPEHRGQYVLGPAVELTWGQPRPLVWIDLALALELPSPLRLLLAGRLSARLPEETVPLVTLNLDVLGILDLTHQEASLDATLFDSRIGPYSLSGEMAMRATWGDRPGLTLAVGGLHPGYSPPPDFPDLDRISVALGAGDNPSIQLGGYLAVTSNTVQFGARAALYASAAGFTVEAALGFDALLQLSPFRFEVAIRAEAELRRGDRRLFLVDLHLEKLAGPSPWEAQGYAKFRIAFVSFSVSFETTFGTAEDSTLSPPDVWGDLRDALAAPGSWSGQVPTDGSGVVELADTGADTPLLHPLAPAVLQQGVVPLGETIERHDGRPVPEPRTFSITEVSVPGPAGVVTADTRAVEDRFAPAAFLELTDAEKLDAPAFERYEAGVAVTVDDPVRGEERAVPHGYDVVMLRSDDEVDDGDDGQDDDLLAAEAFAASLTAVPTGPAHRRFGREGPKLTVRDLAYALVDPDTLGTAADQPGTTSYARTRQQARTQPGTTQLAAHLAHDGG